MTNHGPNGESDLQRLQERNDAINAEMKALQELPEKLQMEEMERQRTLPPSDLVTSRIKEKSFDDLVARGEVTNTRREVTRNLFLMLLLLIAAVVMLLWAYRSLQRYGFF